MLSYNLNERLLTAVHSGNFDETLHLLMQGAQATYISSTCGRTAVGTAASLGDAEILELLLQSCEEPDLDVFRHSRDCADSLEMDNTPEGMEKLEWVDEFESTTDSVDSQSEPNAEDSLYYYYAKTFENTGEFLTNGQLNLCESCRQDAHNFDTEMATPLHYAASWGHEACVRLLLDHNAPINVMNSHGYTPLHVGVGFPKVTQLLINHGAQVNERTLTDGKTPLHLAIESESDESVELLFQTNVNINATDDMGETPLIAAITCNQIKVAKQLVKRGAHINIQDQSNRTAFYYAVISRHVALAELLLQNGARRFPSHHLLHHCVENDDRELTELLLRHGDSLCVRNEDNHTPVLVAIHHQLPEMLEYLLEVAETHKKMGLYSEAMEQDLLLFAVHSIASVKEFRSILRVLLAKLPSARHDLYNARAPTVCEVTYCQTPLSRAINTQRLDIAEVLLHEGCNIDQICRRHVIEKLNFNNSPRRRCFRRLLDHIGFKLPQERHPKRTELSTAPLSLQSLSRQVIRGCLLKQLQQQPLVQIDYLPTLEMSTLSLMIDKLCIPTSLKCYLSHFSDLSEIHNIEEEVCDWL